MKKMELLPLIIAMTVVVVACSQRGTATTQAQAPALLSIVGSLYYRERIALPPGSIATISLNDISRADALSVTVSEQTLALEGGQVPIAFELETDPESLELRSSYAVRAVIRDGDGRLLWTTDTVYPVSVPADASIVDLGMLRLVSVPRSGPAESAIAPLAGEEWVVEDIDGRGIIDYSRVTLVFGDDGTLSGRTTCNSYTGSYTLDGDSLETGQLAVTMRACAEALLRQEKHFLRILGDAANVSFDSTGALIVTTSIGETLLARSRGR